jgi:hypothetical protein
VRLTPIARAALDRIHNPVGLAKSYLASRGLLGGPDEDDLTGVAMEAVVNAALSWSPGKGASITTWAWRYMHRDVERELARCYQHRAELTAWQDADPEQWRYRQGIDEYQRVVDRVDLQRWADLAELTPLMRFLVEYWALHAGTYVRDTAGAGPAPQPSRHPTVRLAIGHMRKAATSGQRRDDRWTRHYRHSPTHLGARSDQVLARLRAIEAERDRRLSNPPHSSERSFDEGG